jgi:radical SAM-linked protein
MIRCRVLYCKTEPLRYTGMLDIQSIWERLFRRAHLELAYSQGFHPQPRIQQAAPLPLGFLSTYEILDFWLEGSRLISEIAEMIRNHPHPGLDIQKTEEVELGAPVLQSRLESASYLVTPLVEMDRSSFKLRIYHLLTEKSIVRTRRGKEYDLRPLIQSLRLPEFSADQDNLEMVLTAREGATGRPEEVLAAMNFDPFSFRYCRVKLDFSIKVFSEN